MIDISGRFELVALVELDVYTPDLLRKLTHWLSKRKIESVQVLQNHSVALGVYKVAEYYVSQVGLGSEVLTLELIAALKRLDESKTIYANLYELQVAYLLACKLVK